MKALLIAAIFAAGTAMADDMILKGEPGYYARLQDAPCTNAAILAHVKEDFRPMFKAAIVGTPTESIPACWVAYAGQVLVTFEDGSDMALPVARFERTGGI